MKILISCKIYGSSSYKLELLNDCLRIYHTKNNPGDVESFIDLESITIDDIVFEEAELREGIFYVDSDIHPDIDKELKPCTVLGCIGYFEFKLENNLELQKIKSNPLYKETDQHDIKVYKKICNTLN